MPASLMNSASRPFAAADWSRLCETRPVAGTVAPDWRSRSTTSRNPRPAASVSGVSPDLSFASTFAFPVQQQAGDARLAGFSRDQQQRRAPVSVCGLCGSPRLQQPGGGAGRGAASRHRKRGLAVGRAGFQGGLAVNQDADQLVLVCSGGRVERGPQGAVGGVDVDTVRDQERRHLRAPAAGGHVQRRPAGFSPSAPCPPGVLLDQRTDHRGIARAGGPVYRAGLPEDRLRAQ